MVHLGEVSNDAEAKGPIVDGLDNLQLGPPGTETEDEFSANVYGSRYAAQDLPRYEMPEGEMPREIAYRMIKDDLTLDGIPTLKFVQFPST